MLLLGIIPKWRGILYSRYIDEYVLLVGAVKLENKPCLALFLTHFKLFMGPATHVGPLQTVFHP